jgi:hypothetical protein
MMEKCKRMKESDAVELFEEMSNFQEGGIFKLESDELANRISKALKELGYCPPLPSDLYNYLEDRCLFEDIGRLEHFECPHNGSESRFVKVSDTHALKVTAIGTFDAYVAKEHFVEFMDDAVIVPKKG